MSNKEKNKAVLQSVICNLKFPHVRRNNTSVPIIFRMCASGLSWYPDPGACPDDRRGWRHHDIRRVPMSIADSPGLWSFRPSA